MQTRGEVFLLSHTGREQLLKEQRYCCGRRRGEDLEIVAHQVLVVFTLQRRTRRHTSPRSRYCCDRSHWSDHLRGEASALGLCCFDSELLIEVGVGGPATGGVAVALDEVSVGGARGPSMGVGDETTAGEDDSDTVGRILLNRPRFQRAGKVRWEVG